MLTSRRGLLRSLSGLVAGAVTNGSMRGVLGQTAVATSPIRMVNGTRAAGLDFVLSVILQESLAPSHPRVVRVLLEKQALRRIESGSLTDEEIERLGRTLLGLQEQVDWLKGEFGLTDHELNLDLGPLGKLI